MLVRGLDSLERTVAMKPELLGPKVRSVAEVAFDILDQGVIRCWFLLPVGIAPRENCKCQACKLARELEEAIQREQ